MISSNPIVADVYYHVPARRTCVSACVTLPGDGTCTGSYIIHTDKNLAKLPCHHTSIHVSQEEALDLTAPTACEPPAAYGSQF